MKSGLIIRIALALALGASLGLMLGSPAHAGHDYDDWGRSGSNTVRVDCNDGESINGAIRRSSLSQKLTISVRGTCVENVIIDRDWVTLQPSKYGGGSIEAITGGTEIWAVGVFGAQNVIIQNFDSIDGAGGLFAILISNGAQATIRNNTLHDAAQALGVYRNSTAIVEDNWLLDNSVVGLLVTQSSGVIARRNTIHTNDYGAWILDSSHGNFSDNKVYGNSVTGVEVSSGSSAKFDGDTITDNGTGVRILWNSFVQFWRDATAIHDNSNYGVICDLNSSMNLFVAPNFTGGNAPGNIEDSGCTP